MKRFALLTGTLAFLFPLVSLEAKKSSRPDWHWTKSSDSSTISLSNSQKYRFVGDFSLIGFAKYRGIILQNNNLYQVHKNYAKKIKDWQLGDTIRVLQTKHHHLVLLVNLRTGETAKANPHEVHSH